MPQSDKFLIVFLELFSYLFLHKSSTIIVGRIIWEVSWEVLELDWICVSLHVFIVEIHKYGMVLNVNRRLYVRMLNLNGPFADLNTISFEFLQIAHYLFDTVLECFLFLGQCQIEFRWNQGGHAVPYISERCLSFVDSFNIRQMGFEDFIGMDGNVDHHVLTLLL